jgi:hypothetical protein
VTTIPASLDPYQAWKKLKMIYASADFTIRMHILSHPPEDWRDINYAG